MGDCCCASWVIQKLCVCVHLCERWGKRKKIPAKNNKVIGVCMWSFLICWSTTVFCVLFLFCLEDLSTPYNNTWGFEYFFCKKIDVTFLDFSLLNNLDDVIPKKGWLMQLQGCLVCVQSSVLCVVTLFVHVIMTQWHCNYIWGSCTRGWGKWISLCVLCNDILYSSLTHFIDSICVYFMK